MAAGDTPISIAGNLGDDPELRYTQTGQAVANFRVASTPRFMDRATNEWKDGDSLFLTCNVWRQAAENAAESLQRGMRVIVSGRLRQRSYETKEGEKRTVDEVEVDDVGPSLRNASAKVTRSTRSSGGGFGGGGQGGQSGRGYGGGSGSRAANDPWASESGDGGTTDEPPFLLLQTPTREPTIPADPGLCRGAPRWPRHRYASRRRRFACSARKRSNTSTTRTRRCCASSSPTGTRSAPGGSPVTARSTSATSRPRSRTRARWRCCPTPAPRAEAEGITHR